MSGDKTEKATPKKLKDLRKKGVVARSVELPSGVSLLALVLVLPGMVSRLLDVLRTDMTVVFSSADVTDVTQAKGLAGRVLLDSVRSIAPSVAIVGGAAIVAGSLVTRSRPNPAAIKPKMERLNPGKAIKRMLSPHSVNELVKNVAKLSALGLVAVGSWKTGSKELLASGGSSEAMQAIVGATVRSMLWRVAVLALLVGVADAAWQRRSFGKQSRMSKQDVSDENKQSEGNPHTKGQMRQRMLSNSRSRMIQAVPKADVVLAGTSTVAIGPVDLPLKEGANTIVYAWGSAADKNLKLAVQTISGMDSAPGGVNAGTGGQAAAGSDLTRGLLVGGAAVLAGGAVLLPRRRRSSVER